jgi:anti-sigma regulatory factor (Ser/Thr protein kinase)
VERLPDVVSLVRAAGAGGVCRVEDESAITLSYVLDNDPAQIAAVVAEIMDAAARFGLFDEPAAHRVALALQEAILNAMHHGNLELDSRLRQGDERDYRRLANARRTLPPYVGRRVHVEARLDAEMARVVVRDEGRGFDPTRLPDPTMTHCLERPSGRGLLLIRTYMDEVTYNATGTEITLVKRRSRC